MEPRKIAFNHEEFSFGVRAAGLMLKGNQLLLQQPETFDFWTFPGGGVHLDETLHEALVREWREETGFEVEVKRLLYIIEGFFNFDYTDHVVEHVPAKGRVHGYGFCFLVEPTEEGIWLEDEFYGQEDIEYQGRDLKITFRWFSPEELYSINLLPVCLKQALQTIPNHPLHIVDRET